MPLWNLSQPCRSHRVLQQGARHCSLGQHVVLLVVSLVGPWPLRTLEPCCPQPLPLAASAPLASFLAWPGLGVCLIISVFWCLPLYCLYRGFINSAGSGNTGSGWCAPGTRQIPPARSRCKHPANVVWCLHLAWGWLWACASVLSPGWS